MPKKIEILGSMKVREPKVFDEPAVLPAVPMIDAGFVQPTPPQVDQITGPEIQQEFAEKKRDCDEGICSDALIYLRTGLSKVAVLEVVRLRRGAEYGYTKAKAEAAIDVAVELLAKGRKVNADG